jgi:hypothetical protein
MNRSELEPEMEKLDDAQLKEIWEAGLELEADGYWEQELFLASEVSTSIKEINMIRKEMLQQGPCHLCGEEKSGKKLKCGMCGRI